MDHGEEESRREPLRLLQASKRREDSHHGKNSGDAGASGGMRKLDFRTQLQFDFNLDEYIDGRWSHPQA
jgi:hypothetical protein